MNTDTGENKFLSSGVRAMFLSTLAFSLTYAFVKQLSHIPAVEVAFFRCAIASAFCFIGLYRAGVDWRGSNRKMLLLRGFFRHHVPLSFLFYAAAHTVGRGGYDPISFADLYHDHRDLYFERES